MPDDPDDLNRSTEPLPPVDDLLTQGRRTEPFPAASRGDELDHAKTAALPAIDEKTQPVAPEIVMPDDETGYLPAALVDDPALDVPTTELPDEQTLTRAAEAYREELGDGDVTRPGAVTDDAIVRKIVLPDVPGARSPQPEPPDRDATQMAPLPQAPRVPLPDEQRPPARGPVPLPRFRQGRPPREPDIEDDRTPYVDGEAESPQRRQLWAHVWAAGAAIAWGIVTYVIAFANWVEPGRLLIVSLGALLPIALVAAYIARPPERGLRLDDIFELRRPVQIAGLLLLVGPLPWQIGLIRNELRPLAGTSARDVRAVMLDRADYVVEAECVRAAGSFGEAGVADAFAEVLGGKPSVLRDCLARVDAPGLREALATRWLAELGTDGVSAARRCAVTQSLTELDIEAGRLDAHFGQCVLTAPAEVGACCATSLAEARARKTWTATMDTPPFVPDAAGSRALVTLAFDVGLTAPQAELKAQSTFTGEPAQRMAFVLACAALDSHPEVAESLADAVPKACAVEASALPRDAASWKSVCEISRDRLVRRRRDPAETLCDGARAVATSAAAARASTQIHDARSVARRTWR